MTGSGTGAVAVTRVLSPSDAQLRGLADVLLDCVDGGASVGFMHPLSPVKALAYWADVADGVARGERVLLVAEDGAGVAGTVQLVFAPCENQPHRADLVKMLVHRRARRGGVGAALLRAAETAARACGRNLLTLDTASDDAARLYARHGWRRAGVVPDYALLPHGGLCRTIYYYRQL
jgi:GNAT superfamily N-acetyltransferase